MTRVTIGLVQASASDSIEGNIRRTAELVREAAGKGATLICLQELCCMRYPAQHRKKDASSLAEGLDGRTVTAFAALAKGLGVGIIVPLYEKAKIKLFNTAAVIDSEGKIMGSYRKVHIPYDPCYYEKDYFAEGDAGFQIFEMGGVKFSVLICYDQWFPEAARAVTLKGAELIFYPTAIGNIIDGAPDEDDWHDSWKTIQRSHAIANGTHVAAVNRVGKEGSLHFWGGSFICDSFGRVLAEAGDKEGILVATLELSKNKAVRDGWGFLRNRRPDCYGILAGQQGR